MMTTLDLGPGLLLARMRRGLMQIAVLGIDLGKNSCSVVGLDVAGRVVLRNGPDGGIWQRSNIHTSGPETGYVGVD